MAGNVPDDNLQENQEKRFLAAFDEYGDALFRHAQLRLSDRERAIDVVHDTFAKAWLYVKDGHEVESFRAFLYKILNNLIIDEYRKNRDSSLDALFEKEGVGEESFEELKEDSTESLVAGLDGRKAFDLLTELPDQYREVVVLRFIDGLGPREISQLIEESENVVSVRLHRGLKRLRQLLDTKEEQAEIRRRKNKKSQRR